MQLQEGETVLYKAIPMGFIYNLIIIMTLGLGLIILFPLEPRDFLILCGIFLISLVPCSYLLIVTNQRIIFRKFLSAKTISLHSLPAPKLKILPYTLKKYEWHRKLLRQDFQKFWLDKAIIHFQDPSNSNALETIPLSLFSKKQRAEIISILQETCHLNPLIEH